MEVFEGCIGIDLGTTYSCVGVWMDDHVEIIPNDLGNRTTPSWVAFTDVDKLVGNAAMDQVLQNPENTIYDVKRLMGKRFTDEILQEDMERLPYTITSDINDAPLIEVTYKGEKRQFKPEQISALILSKMKEVAEAWLGKIVKKAIVTVPAYFNDSQRTATKNAAKIAGLDCLKIINEPTAACMCYGLDKRPDKSKVLIFDLGGGTFDVSVLNLTGGIFEVLATNGDTHLGGEDFDHVVSDFLIEEFTKKNAKKLGTSNPAEIKWSSRSLRRFMRASETAKRTLSTSLQASVIVENICQDLNGNTLDFCYKLTRDKFNNICLPLFKRCFIPVEKVILDANEKSHGELSDIILVGGSTRIPYIQEMLSKHFGGMTLNKSVNPDEAVAYGAAVQGAISAQVDISGKTKDLLLLDVTPLSLGIETRGGVMSNIIDRNTQLPVKKSKMFTTSEDRQRTVGIKIYEGERRFTADNHKIANFDLTGIPAQSRGVPKINVTFSISADGILTVEAVDRDSATKNEIVVTDTERLTQNEINKMVDEAEEFRAEDELRKDALNCRHEFEKELSHIQNAINDPQLITDDKGNPIMDEKDLSFINECILNNLIWLEENDDLTQEKIDMAKKSFTHHTKPVMSKIYARKTQLDLGKKYEEKTDINVQDILDKLFTSPSDTSDIKVDSGKVKNKVTFTIKKK